MDLNVIVAIALFAAAAMCLVQAYRRLADRAVDHMRGRWVAAAHDFLAELDAAGLGTPAATKVEMPSELTESQPLHLTLPLMRLAMWNRAAADLAPIVEQVGDAEDFDPRDPDVLSLVRAHEVALAELADAREYLEQMLLADTEATARQSMQAHTQFLKVARRWARDTNRSACDEDFLLNMDYLLGIAAEPVEPVLMEIVDETGRHMLVVRAMLASKSERAVRDIVSSDPA